LARLAVVAEGSTEVGLLRLLLEIAFETDPLDHGVRVCDGQGNASTLGLLETLSSSGALFAGLVDNEGTDVGRWQAVKQKLGGRLHQWKDGCTEQHVIAAIADNKLLELLKDADGKLDGNRLRTLADRLDIQDKQLGSIEQALADKGETLRQLILAAATGNNAGAPVGDEKAWKSHSGHWFKSENGGRELAQKMVALGAWKTVGPQILPLLNAILAAVDLPVKEELEL
jgi:putative ATP-dependent endonuclease of OLD family